MNRFMITVVTAAVFSTAAIAQTNSSVNGSANGSIDPSATPGNAATAAQSTSADQSAPANKQGADASAGAVQSATLNAALSKSVDAKKAKEGDQVMAKTTQDTTTSDGTKIPKNTKLVGHVTEAKAKGKDDAQSSLAFVFDKAVLKGGQEVPLHAVIQAVAAAPQVPMGADAATSSDAGYGPPNAGSSGSMGSRPAANGGAVGGATNAVGQVANTATGAVDNAAGAAGSVAQSSAGTAAVLSGNASGVVGIKDVQLQQATGASANASVPTLTSTHGNVRLDSGTQLVLKSASVSASTDAGVAKQ
jgi:hypothetical protein